MTERLKSSELVRYAIAARDLHFAAEVCGLMIEEIPNPVGTHYWAYHTAAVTAYARPFTEMKPLGMMPGTATKILTRDERQLHRRLLDERNTARAHSDVSRNPVLFSPAAATVGQDDPLAGEDFLGITSDPWEHETWHAVRALALRLSEHFKQEAFRVLEELGGSEAMLHMTEVELD